MMEETEKLDEIRRVLFDEQEENDVDAAAYHDHRLGGSLLR